MSSVRSSTEIQLSDGVGDGKGNGSQIEFRTYYFGSNASLKDRHRRQDPDSALFSLFQSVQQEQHRLCVAYGAPTNC